MLIFENTSIISNNTIIITSIFEFNDENDN